MKKQRNSYQNHKADLEKGGAQWIFTCLNNFLIDRELEKKGGQLVACFVDYKAAFDTVDRNVLWKIMKRKNVNKWLTGRINDDIYKETKMWCELEIE